VKNESTTENEVGWLRHRTVPAERRGRLGDSSTRPESRNLSLHRPPDRGPTECGWKTGRTVVDREKAKMTTPSSASRLSRRSWQILAFSWKCGGLPPPS